MINVDKVKSYLPSMSKSSDEAFWVSVSEFRNNFDQDDFKNRDIECVFSYYRSDWFEEGNGNNYFILPCVTVIGDNGVTQFINGRHRTAVLIKHMKKIPMAFAEGKAKALAKELKLKPLEELFELPKLPIF